MTPKSPIAEAKISITRIFTKRVGFVASDKASELPVAPTLVLSCHRTAKRRGESYDEISETIRE
jgi:hypothetical protein